MSKPSSVPLVKAKPADKPAGKAPTAPAGKPGDKPKGAAAKPGDEALPDAALLDHDGEGGEGAPAVPAPRTGLRRFLPTSKLGWAIAASVLVTVIGGASAAAIFLKPAPAPSALVKSSAPPRWSTAA